MAFRILWSSDHHTCHQTTPTYHILGNLSTFYYKAHDLSKVKLVIKGGDLTERLVEAPNPDFLRLKKWGKEFLDTCHQHGVAVLVLEGTSSHDWGQPKHLETLAHKDMDFRYVDTLSIQHYPQLDGFTVMCVPDNMGSATPDEVWELALKVLNEHKLTKVDLIAFHGTWPHQLPGHAMDKKHNPARWESICNYLILSGHIHIPSVSGLIHSSGSFDRTKHGEEHPKGAYVVDIDQTKKTFKATFWENTNALPYVTLKVSEDITPETLVRKLHEFIKEKKLPNHGQVRVLGGLGDVVNPVLSIFEREYPHLGFSAKNAKSEELLVAEDLFNDTTYEGTTLTKDNLDQSLWPEVEVDFEKLGISKEEALQVLETFK